MDSTIIISDKSPHQFSHECKNLTLISIPSQAANPINTQKVQLNHRSPVQKTENGRIAQTTWSLPIFSIDEAVAPKHRPHASHMTLNKTKKHTHSLHAYTKDHLKITAFPHPSSTSSAQQCQKVPAAAIRKLPTPYPSALPKSGCGN
ncbi:hypothetical protein VFPPC_17412 [Pochonia chlamydosporia 170]|uniref:Uncharacterized protein n=1 Tax=Pochonia chlamydosporia 170 TaxID=1380566 RepID=A0A219AS69_METCM|nr:hypothetical protein VFPPC_17412 [Pochonia chlamydosporia 170]OWT43439.1 hypothetical protein VFPPC_17412 [Pochonia chlamydosporia 170]